MAGKEIKYFFRIAKGSAGEARGRYKRMKKLSPEDLVFERLNILNEIRAMLSSLIQKWK